MVGADDFDLHALGGGAEILDRHARGDHRARPRQIGIGAGHVVHDADLDDAVGKLRVRRAASERGGQRRQAQCVP